MRRRGAVLTAGGRAGLHRHATLPRHCGGTRCAGHPLLATCPRRFRAGRPPACWPARRCLRWPPSRQVASHGRALSFAYPSYLQPALAGILGLRHRRGGPRLADRAPRGRRVAVLAGLVLGVTAALRCVPGLLGQLRDGIIGFLLARDPWLSTHRRVPVRVEPDHRARARATRSGACAGLALPPWPWSGAGLASRERRPASRTLLFIALAMAGSDDRCRSGSAARASRCSPPPAPLGLATLAGE